MNEGPWGHQTSGSGSGRDTICGRSSFAMTCPPAQEGSCHGATCHGATCGCALRVPLGRLEPARNLPDADRDCASAGVGLTRRRIDDLRLRRSAANDAPAACGLMRLWRALERMNFSTLS